MANPVDEDELKCLMSLGIIATSLAYAQLYASSAVFHLKEKTNFLNAHVYLGYFLDALLLIYIGYISALMIHYGFKLVAKSQDGFVFTRKFANGVYFFGTLVLIPALFLGLISALNLII